MHKFTAFRGISIVIIILIMGLSTNLTAQNPVKPEQKSYTAPDGKLYWNKQMPVYIRLANSPTDPGQLVKSQTQDDTKPYFFDTEGANYIRSKTSVNADGTRSETAKDIVWEVFADGESPKSAANFNSDTKNTSDTKNYFGNDLSISIAAKDKLSGVENTYYSINGLPFTPFTTALQINREGEYTLEFYATDHVGNVEQTQKIDFSLDLTPPVTQHSIAGGMFKELFSVDTRIIFAATDFGSGVSDIFYAFDDESPRKYSGSHVSVAALENGDHVLHYYAIDRVKNKETEHTFSFYLDKKAPILSSVILGDQFVKDNKIYFSGRSRLSLSATDDKSGLQEIQYSMNGSSFSHYNEPFYLPGVSGLHTVKYFALDSMQNRSETQRLIDAKYQNMVVKQEDLYADITSPALDFDFLGTSFKTRDTLFLGGNTNIRFKGADSESGINRIVYYIDDKPSAETYSLPFSLEYITSGPHKMRIVCYDNVNNQTSKEFHFILDNTPPELHYFFSVSPYTKQGGLDVYPAYVNVFLAASDATTGAKNVTYSLNDSPVKPYIGYIGGFIEGKNALKIFTKDNLDNDKELEILFIVK